MYTETKHRIVVISPDEDTDYCYLDMSREEAVRLFQANEDWARLYQPRGLLIQDLNVKEGEFDRSFILCRGATFAKGPWVTKT